MTYSSKLFGARLREQRKKAKETQKKLADFLSVKPNQICEMENGRKGSTFERLFLLCRHYNVSADYLLGLTDDPRPRAEAEGEERGVL
ncbi:XRE family transcriptional regulator [Pseudoflavonifractor sp. 524-17]|uniref:helix-turn-helix domain-containing protein n=1 Tax=Pseudoflavonifractor sp. 524-17 TaxID=2304577 RepID=UPI00137A90A1|nr:helix-turn-helix transcriptional regulator [Pseudoflavonifractor sp. 524-17]NCE63343.1 XRE family transcriptional regulator [Pseudoflavonifractor sp. 524-17]